jgi:putative FmdB family regulatory protein
LTISEVFVPTYSYACTECGNRFDEVQAFSDDALTTCPQCSGRLRKLFGNVGVVFKGSGFYRNDSRETSKSAASTSSSSAPSSNGSSGGSESSSADKSTSKSSSDSSSGSSSSAPAAAASS